MPTRRTPKPVPASPSELALSAAFGELARRRAGAPEASMDAVFALADCEFDATCADVAAEYNVARPAAVTARYVTEWA